MADLNPNLARAARSPIMEAAGWVAEATIPPDRPLLDLSQAAPALPPHPLLRAHLADALVNRTDAHFYGPVLGNAPLRDTLASRTARLYQGSVERANVAITAGCNQAFCTAIQTIAKPGDAVMLPYPWYFNHKMWLDIVGVDCVPLPCDGALMPDLDKARSLLTGNVRAIVLVTPNNPTGAEYPPALLDAFFDFAADAGIALVLDETYRDFHGGRGAPHQLFSRRDWGETLIHLYSFSKAYRLTGHRTGAMITGERRIAEAEKFLDTVTICPSQTGQIASLFGLENLAEWVQAERAEFAARRGALTTFFHEHLPEWTLHGAGAYFAWVTPPGDLPSEIVARRLVAEQSVLILPGSMFLPSDIRTQSLRIAFANVDIAAIRVLGERLAMFRP